MRLLIAAVVVLSAARSALGSAYVGCFPSSDVTGFTPPTSGLTQPSNGACIAACQANSQGYSYYIASTSHCYCSASTVFPTPGDLQQGTVGNPGGCSSGLAIATRIPTSFSFDGCFVLDVSLFNPPIEVSRPDVCFSDCANFDFAVIGGLPTTPNSLMDCYCGNGVNLGVTAIRCPAHGVLVQDGAYFYDDHHGSHGFSRRKALEQAVLKQQAANICPAGLKPCHIDGADDKAFECIDPVSDIESCGGCVFGEFETGSSNSTVGVNCLDAPGQALGGVTCSSGQCEVSKCKPGYHLKSGKCVYRKRRR
ncbi:hypothetical protein JCM24511_04497 [Saitozyma sp. JCM 24511]|nr:hypothetical protein JCM24511_04497 [Saitozyma sp. JCM 24511]